MYYSDPDDDLVELQVDNFGDWSKSSEWMRTSFEFAANPIGVFFDPGFVYDAYRSGRSPPELHLAVMPGQFRPDPLGARSGRRTAAIPEFADIFLRRTEIWVPCDRADERRGRLAMALQSGRVPD